jgi:hypothetical protein
MYMKANTRETRSAAVVNGRSREGPMVSLCLNEQAFSMVNDSKVRKSTEVEEQGDPSR